MGATGKVGRVLVRQIYNKGDTDQGVHTNPTVIVGLANSSTLLRNSEGIDAKMAERFVMYREGGERYSGFQCLLELLRKENEIIHVVDVTTEARAVVLHTGLINSTNHDIVTANKNPLTFADIKTFRRLVSETQRYGFRCSVMAGADTINYVMDLVDLNDRPHSIEGCLSGTLGFVLSELENGKKLSSAVTEAITRGYTEPNPITDLGGGDPAKKILIIARAAGFDVSFSDIEVNPLVSEAVLKSADLDSFFTALKKQDLLFEKKMKRALNKNNTLRYVARITSRKNEKSRIRVGLEEVPIKSSLGQLKGTSNKILIYTKNYGRKPYSIEAPGAGIEITAQNIRRDLLYQINGRTLRVSPDK